MKLGRLPTVHDPRTLRLERYGLNLPHPPREVHRSQGVWPMFANDTVGDCTIAAAGHLIESWSREAHNPEPRIADQEILAAYAAITGYDPKTGQNDNGAVELDVLRYWQQTGIAGNRLGAYAAVDPRNALHVKQAVWLFGGCYLGLDLPVTAQTQRVWDTPPGGLTGEGTPGSWGGHAVPIVSYDPGFVTVITWGEVKLCSWRFIGAYCTEAYALLDDLMLRNGKSPQGFALPALQHDLAEVKA